MQNVLFAREIELLLLCVKTVNPCIERDCLLQEPKKNGLFLNCQLYIPVLDESMSYFLMKNNGTIGRALFVIRAKLLPSRSKLV